MVSKSEIKNLHSIIDKNRWKEFTEKLDLFSLETNAVIRVNQIGKDNIVIEVNRMNGSPIITRHKVVDEIYNLMVRYIHSKYRVSIFM